MKIIVIGSVAAGTSVGAKARRNNEEVEIKIFDKDTDISYSSCGLPYYIGEDYIKRDNLTPRNSEWFKKRFNIDIYPEHEVIEIDKEKKEIVVKDLNNLEIKRETYDKLVLATGSTPNKLNIPSDSSLKVFKLKTVKNADEIKNYIANNSCKKAIVIGSGYIGLEMIDNLKKMELDITLLEKENQISSNLDKEISKYVENELIKNNIDVKLNSKIVEIKNKYIILDDGSKIEGDFIISAIGVKANTFLGKMIDIDTGIGEAYVVDDSMQTSVSDIYAVGDCALTYNRITGEETYIPLGSTANKMGRVCGDRLTGGNLEFKGILGTSIYKIFDMTVACTGLTESKARELEYEVEVIHNIKPNQSQYFNSSREMLIKGIADKNTGKLLGVQIIGEKGVDKRIDVFATAISYGGKVEDFFNLDLAYAPPFSTTKDPVAYTGMVLENSINKQNPILTAEKLIKNREDYIVIDVRSIKQFEANHIEGALNIPLENIRSRFEELDKEKTYVVHCNKGVSGNTAQNLLLNLGFKKVYNLSGGFKHYKVEKSI